jgi:phosphonate transport system substrate-binding protein
MKRFLEILVAIVILGSPMGCSPVLSTPEPSLNSTACDGPAIALGEISDDPDEVISESQVLADFLAGHLAAFGIQCGKVKVANNVKEMVKAINAGEVDIYFDSMFPATLVSDATGAKPILRRWRNCDPEYYSVIATTTGSDIRSIADLPGHMVAMDRPDSTSGMVLPAAYLLEHGLKLAVKNTYDEPVAADEVGIHFSYDDQNTRNLLMAGKVSAGATDDYSFHKWESLSPGKLVVLAETEPALRQAVLLRPTLDRGLQSAIKQILRQADQNPEDLAIIEQVVGTCKYDEAPEGLESSFAEMRSMYSLMLTIPGWSEALEQIE